MNFFLKKLYIILIYFQIKNNYYSRVNKREKHESKSKAIYCRDWAMACTPQKQGFLMNTNTMLALGSDWLQLSKSKK